MMQRRRSTQDGGETADEALDRRIAEVQREREGRRALSAPRRIEGGVRRLELQAAGSGGDGAQGEVARPAGLPQALGPETQMVVAQQTTGPVPGGGQGRAAPVVAGQFLWGAAQGVAGAVGTQLQALGDALRPGAQGRPGVPQGGPSGLLPLQGNDQGVGERNGGQARGGLLGPLAEPMPPLVAFQLPQDQLQMGSAVDSHQPVLQPQGGQPAALQDQGGMVVPATNQGGMGSEGMVTQAVPQPGTGNPMMVTPVREPRDPMAVPMVSPVPMQMVSPVPMAQANRMSPPPAGYDPTGGNQRMLMDPAAHAVEEIRLRVMREAEEAFAREVRRLQQTAEETQSYQSASSGAGVGTGIGQTMGVPQPVGGGRTSPPRGMGGTPLPPPGLAATGNGTVSGSLSEALILWNFPSFRLQGEKTHLSSSVTGLQWCFR